VKVEEDLSRRQSFAAEEDPLSERSSRTPSYSHATHSHQTAGAATMTLQAAAAAAGFNVLCATAQQRENAAAGYPTLGATDVGGQQLQQQQQHHHNQHQGYPQLVSHHHPLNPIFHQIQTNWTAMYSHIQQPPQ
jgi:hypothetical protein